jgi:hypothetical protein
VEPDQPLPFDGRLQILGIERYETKVVVAWRVAPLPDFESLPLLIETWRAYRSFAPDGPERCSGLPVTRYSADELGSALGTDFKVVKQRREVHTTPGGGVQPFTWIAARCVLTCPISPPGE